MISHFYCHLKVISDFIPSANPVLTAAVYEKILNEFLTARNYRVSLFFFVDNVA